MTAPRQTLNLSEVGHDLLTCQADYAIWKRLVRWSALSEWVMPLPVDETMFRPRDEDERKTTRTRHDLPSDAP